MRWALRTKGEIYQLALIGAGKAAQLDMKLYQFYCFAIVRRRSLDNK